MKQSTIGAMLTGLALMGMTVSAAHAQDSCGPAEGVDLAVQSARLRQREDGWVVLYTVVNRGRMPSTSYRVALVVDGAIISDEDEYAVGLEPGHRRRWELELLPEALPTNGHEVAVRVATADPSSPAGPSYADQCSADDLLPVSQAESRGA
jgi:hypothetical protein